MRSTTGACRRVVVAMGVTMLGACAQPGPGPLYLWEAFPRQQYETLRLNGNGVPADQIIALQAHAAKARAAGAALPPGFRAHLGMLMLSTGDAQGAREAWRAEKLAFPESALYMDQLLKRLEAPVVVDSPT